MLVEANIVVAHLVSPHPPSSTYAIKISAVMVLSSQDIIALRVSLPLRSLGVLCYHVLAYIATYS